MFPENLEMKSDTFLVFGDPFSTKAASLMSPYTPLYPFSRKKSCESNFEIQSI